MSRFYVGQRVRVVASDQTDKRPIGREGFVNELGCFLFQVDAQGVGVTIPGLAPLPEPGKEWDETGWAFLVHELEPIVPPGMESIADTLALWLPEGIPA